MRKSRIMSLSAAALAVAATYGASAQTPGGGGAGAERCAEAKRALPGYACVATPHGVAMAPAEQRAGELARYAATGELAFRRYFAMEPTNYAVVENAAGAPVAKIRGTLRAAGFRTVLPWLSAEGFASSAAASLQANVEAMAKQRGLNEEQTAALVAKAKEQIPNRGVNNTEMRDGGAMPHELGHMWFLEAYWPGTVPDRESHYGTPAPDWMDEVSAMLMEGGRMPDNRRDQFKAIYTGHGKAQLASYPAAELIDLPRFLGRTHPGKALQDRIMRSGAGSPTMGQPIVLQVKDNDALGKAGLDAAVFYLQGRVFADFLIEKSRDEAIFASLGRAFGKGQTFEQWLAANGRKKRLTDSISGLDRQWREWLAARYGPPAAAPAGR
jgi:hypothetical protein